ncbi:hypothetical protein EV1_044965 [Malus domestica]
MHFSGVLVTNANALWHMMVTIDSLLSNDQGEDQPVDVVQMLAPFTIHDIDRLVSISVSNVQSSEVRSPPCDVPSSVPSASTTLGRLLFRSEEGIEEEK